MASFGRSLELHFINGRPEGLLTARVFNWTGQVLKAPRTQLRDALLRPEAACTGVYILLGEQDGAPLAYIGEGEEVGARIRDHDGRKDWWADALIVTAVGDELNKAHVKYLESRLVETARRIAAVALENGNTPPRASLSEAGIANMEAFLDTLFIVLPALGIDIFTDRRRPEARPAEPGGEAAARFTLETRRHGIAAAAILRNGEFVVLQGSTARNDWVGEGTHDAGYAEQHRRLVAAGVIARGPDHATFTENWAFRSPSAAAAVVNGRPSNGRAEWKASGTRTSFGEWEADQIARIPLPRIRLPRIPLP